MIMPQLTDNGDLVAVGRGAVLHGAGCLDVIPSQEHEVLVEQLGIGRGIGRYAR